MKSNLLSIFLLFFAVIPPVHSTTFQKQSKKVLTQAQALERIRAAEDVADKLTLAEEYTRGFPNNEFRQQVVQLIADEIEKLKDAREAVRVGEEARRFFTNSSDRETIAPVLLDAYCLAGKTDQAFALAAELLAANPDDIRVLIQMTLTGTEQAKRRNGKFGAQSLAYGSTAISLIEADRKPANLSDEDWTRMKAALPQLYQQTAVLHLIAGNSVEAQARLSKASALDPNDPYPFAVLGRMMADEYVKRSAALASSGNAVSEDEKKSVEELLDKIIETYARTVALARGRFQYQLVMTQVVPSLTSYYVVRYKSTAGLQELIDRYTK